MIFRVLGAPKNQDSLLSNNFMFVNGITITNVFLVVSIDMVKLVGMAKLVQRPASSMSLQKSY